MDVDVGLFLLHQQPGLLRAVVGAAEQSRQRDHIHIVHPAAVGVQIALGRGAGGAGSLLGSRHAGNQILRCQHAVVLKHIGKI